MCVSVHNFLRRAFREIFISRGASGKKMWVMSKIIFTSFVPSVNTCYTLGPLNNILSRREIFRKPF